MVGSVNLIVGSVSLEASVIFFFFIKLSTPIETQVFSSFFLIYGCFSHYQILPITKQTERADYSGSCVGDEQR